MRYSKEQQKIAKAEKRALATISVNRKYAHEKGGIITVCGVVSEKTQKALIKICELLMQDKA